MGKRNTEFIYINFIKLVVGIHLSVKKKKIGIGNRYPNMSPNLSDIAHATLKSSNSINISQYFSELSKLSILK